MVKNYVNSFFKRIVKDLRQKELLPIKFVFFMQTSTILVLYPYLTIHMRELGINVEETAIMSAITPVIGILMPPVAGMLADKIGNFRVLLAFFSLLGGLASLALLLVPVGRVTIEYPKEMVLGLQCKPNEKLFISMYDRSECADTNTDVKVASFNLKQCGLICYQESDKTDQVLTAKSYDFYVSDQGNSNSTTIKYVPTWQKLPNYNKKFLHNRVLKNNEKYNSTIRKIANDLLFFPTSDFIGFSCANGIASNETDNRLDLFENGGRKCGFNLNFNGIGGDTRGLYEFGAILKGGVMENFTKAYEVEYIQNKDKEKLPTTCGLNIENQKIFIHVVFNETVNDHLQLQNCTPGCIGTIPRTNLCTNPKTVIEYDVKMTFWTYLAIRVLIGIIGGTAYTMFEGAVIASLREYKADYGLQRVYASIGGMISSPLSGWLIDYVSEGKGYNDFRPIFYLYAILKSISAFLMLFINLEFKAPAKSVVKDVLAVINIELVSLFVTCFLQGSAWGYIESFLFWLIQDLGGSKILMGLTITVGGILGIPLLVLSGPMVKQIGHANIIFIGFIAYAIRLFGYSVIYNPWYSLIFEAMECLTHSLCFTAAITYAAKLSTPTTDSTIQGIFGGLFYGVGRSAGSLVGGYLITLYGIRRTFQFFSVTTALTGIFYILFYQVYMKQRSAVHKELVENRKKNAEKTQNGLENIDMEKPAKEIDAQEEKIHSLPYEDAVTNLAFEGNEDKEVKKI